MKFQSKTLKIGGENFTVSEMSAGQRREIFKLFKDEIDPVEVQAQAILMCCDKFKDSTIEKIMEMPGTVFSKIADEAMKVSGLTDEAEEVAAKNS